MQIFDVLSDQDVFDAILDESRSEMDAKTLSHLLVALAMKKGSGDNLTAQVIVL